MECKECFKPLNEMSLFCDRCGAQINEIKSKFHYTDLPKYLIDSKSTTQLEFNLDNTIKNAYFLSGINDDFKGSSKIYIEQYIDYCLLKIYYQKNYRYLMTSDFSQEKALIIYEALAKRKMSKNVQSLLEEEYPEHYENKTIIGFSK